MMFGGNWTKGVTIEDLIDTTTVLEKNKPTTVSLTNMKEALMLVVILSE